VHLGLIKFIGLYAASISTLVSFASMFFYRIYRLRDVERLNFNIKILIPQIPYIILILISYYSRNIFFQIIAFVFLVAYGIYFLLKEETSHSHLKVIKSKFHK